MSVWERVLSSNITFGFVLLLGAILRLSHVLALLPLPLFNRLIIDSEMYDQWAQSIAAGNWLGGDRAFYMDPLYPYVLAILYRFFEHNLLIVRLFQAGLGVLTCVFIAMIGRRVGGKSIGTLAALLYAVYQPAIFQEGEVEKTALGVFLVTASLALSMRTSCKAKIGGGTLLV